MRTSSVVWRSSLFMLTVFLGACAGTEDAVEAAAPPVPASSTDAGAGSLDDDLADASLHAAEETPQESATPLMTRPAADLQQFSGHVTLTEIVAPGAGPMVEGDGVLKFEAFGPAPGTSPEQFAAWTELVHARFLADPTPEQLVELNRQLKELSIIDATPVFINALLGLDMGEPADIVRAGAITEWWYVAQIRYKQVILDGNPTAVQPQHVRNRMLVVDGWVRLWKRTLKSEQGVARLRGHVAQLIVDRKAARDQQQRAYEEKLRRRAEDKARADAEQATDAAADGP